MINKAQYCPRCGGAIVYYTDDAGRLIKQCDCCRAYRIVGEDIDTMSKFTEAINQDRNSLEIKCDSITLKQNDISICFHSEKDVKQFDSITINGIKFKRVEE